MDRRLSPEHYAFEYSPLATVVTRELSGGILVANKRFRSLFSVSSDHDDTFLFQGVCLSEKWPQTMPENSSDMTFSAKLSSYRNAVSNEYDIFQAEVTMQETEILDDSGSMASAYIIFIDDQTELSLLFNQLEHSRRLASIGQIAAGIGHDFSNSLAMIQGYAELLQVSVKDSPLVMDFSTKIIQSTQRVAELIEKIVDFSKSQAEQDGFSLMDLNVLINDVTEGLALGSRTSSRYEIAASSEQVKVIGNRRKIENALMNLCVNAAGSAGEDGLVTVSTHYEQLSKPLNDAHPALPSGHYAIIAVQDDGEGVSESIRDLIFEPFFTTKANSGGTGLGLGAVVSAMQDHDGAVWLDPDTTQGARFVLYLPLVKK